PYASSLCGACTEACPVKIPLHELLIKHRKKIIEEEERGSFGEKLAMKGFALAANSPKLFKMGTKAAPTVMGTIAKDGKIKKGPGPMKPWTDIRDFPTPSKQSFREWFKAHEKAGKHNE